MFYFLCRTFYLTFILRSTCETATYLIWRSFRPSQPPSRQASRQTQSILWATTTTLTTSCSTNSPRSPNLPSRSRSLDMASNIPFIQQVDLSFQGRGPFQLTGWPLQKRRSVSLSSLEFVAEQNRLGPPLWLWLQSLGEAGESVEITDG